MCSTLLQAINDKSQTVSLFQPDIVKVLTLSYVMLEDQNKVILRRKYIQKRLDFATKNKILGPTGTTQVKLGNGFL